MATTSMRAHVHTPLQTINRGSYFMKPLRSSAPGKQKSAVELLQESKCLYVKSETVLDHHQQLKVSSPDTLHTPVLRVRGPPVPPKSARLRRSYHSSVSSADQLQAKLRRLLNADSKENLLQDTNISEEAKPSPEPLRSTSQKQPPPNPAHHKSLPDLHAGADTGSESSEPASCEYQLYSNNNSRKCSSPRQSTNDDSSVNSSTSRSKQRSSQTSSSSSVGGRLAPALASPVKSTRSFGAATSKTDYIRPDTWWRATNETDADDGTRLRPILRSKSDVGRRHAPLVHSPPAPPDLDTFFEHLGLTAADFSQVTKKSSQSSSPVFFSDTSSVDSGAAAAAGGGGSEGGPAAGEHLSIVERNARIIKWLCNCRKAQLAAVS